MFRDSGKMVKVRKTDEVYNCLNCVLNSWTIMHTTVRYKVQATLLRVSKFTGIQKILERSKMHKTSLADRITPKWFYRRQRKC